MASWNWRVKFPVELDSFSKDMRLTVQLWDADIGSNDCLGSNQISLDKWLRRLFKRKMEKHQYWQPDARACLAYQDGKPSIMTVREEEDRVGVKEKGMENLNELVETIANANSEGTPLLITEPDEELEECKFWCDMKNQDGDFKGRVLLSIEATPSQEFDSRKAGNKREDPNENPVLPKPVGRLKFSLNPCVMIYSLLGPKLCGQLACVGCVLVAILIAYYMLPVVLGEGVYDGIVNLFDEIF